MKERHWLNKTVSFFSKVFYGCIVPCLLLIARLFFTVCLSNCPFLRQLAFSSACPFESMCTCYLFICLSDCLSLCLFVYLSRCSSVCYVLVLVLLLRLWHFEAASDSLNGSIVTASSRSNPGGFLFPGNRYFWATGASHGRTDGRTDRWTDGRSMKVLIAVVLYVGLHQHKQSLARTTSMRRYRETHGSSMSLW